MTHDATVSAENQLALLKRELAAARKRERQLKNREAKILEIYPDINKLRSLLHDLQGTRQALETRVRQRIRTLTDFNEEMLTANAILRSMNSERQMAEKDRRQIFDMSIDLLSVTGFDGSFKELNPAWERTLGWRQDELKARRCVDLVHPDDRECTIASRRRLMAGEPLRGFENRYLKKNGGVCWLSWNSYPDMEREIVISVGRDVTEQKEYQQQLKESAVRYRSLFEDSPISLWEEDFSKVRQYFIELRRQGVTDIGAYLSANEAAAMHCAELIDIVNINNATVRLYGAQDQQELLENLQAVFSKASLPVFIDELAALARGDLRFESEATFKTLGGRRRIVALQVAVAPGYEETLGKVFVSVVDITQRKMMEEELRLLAVTDPLTGASNRRHFMERAKAELARSKRYHHSLHLLYIDLDYFKAVNDTYGHDAGDVVLTAVVATCRSTLREADLFGRMGGEEFAALLIQTDTKAARQTGERLRAAIADMGISCGRSDVRVTASIGMAAVKGSQDTLEALLKRADIALYEAKRSGRNRVCCAP